MADTQQNKHGAAILVKMVEMVTLEMQIAGSDETAARLSAARSVSRSLSLLARALGALNLDVVYAPRAAPAKMRDESTITDPHQETVDIDALRAANPGVNIVPHPDGGVVAAAPHLIYPVTPPRPTLSKPYEFPEHLRVGGSLFNEPGQRPPSAWDLAADTSNDDCCEGEGPQPGAPYSTPPGQDAEDRLRIIAAVVDDQTAFGTDMADFKRRLQKVLGA